MALAQPIICPGEWDAKTSLGFRDTNGSPNLGQTARPYNNKKKKKRKKKRKEKKENLPNVDLVLPADSRVKLKVIEKTGK